MRTFNLMILTALAFLSLAGCATEDDNCGSTSGCVPPPPETCGNAACQADEGETPANCPEDCVPSTCGNGTCDAQESALNCSADCSASCVSDPHRPMYCAEDGLCWPADTDCSLPSFTCANQPRRCEGGEFSWSCCDGIFATCPLDHPYYCAEQGTCVATVDQCPSGNTCETWGAACDEPQ